MKYYVIGCTSCTGHRNVLSGNKTSFHSLITQPLDVIKVRTQLLKRRPEKRRFLRVSRRILKEEGYKAFFHGHLLGQCHAIISFGSQFYIYEILTRFFFQRSMLGNDTLRHTVCGVLAGAASMAIVSPVEVIRVRQIVHKEQYKSFIQGAMAVYKNGGILGFYEGLSASMLQVGPAVGIAFTVFGIVHPRILKYLKHHSDTTPSQNITLASFVAGTAAGFISKTMTYPLDLAKRRLQIASHIHETTPPSTSQKLIRCSNLKDCFQKTWQKEGFFGLYRGWKVTVYKACLTSVVVFTTYEHTCEFVRHMDDKVK